MAEFRMPSLGADMDQGTLVEWRVAPGDTVHHGDIVAVVATDKADIEVEIFADGVLDEVLVAEGEQVPVGTVLATVRAPDAAPDDMPDDMLKPAAVEEPVAAPIPESEPVPGPEPLPDPEPEPGPVAPAVLSPLVRHRADELGVDLADVTGTGAHGVVTRADVEGAAAARTVAATPATDAGRVPASPRARQLATERGLDLATIVGTGPGGAVVARDVEAHRPSTTHGTPDAPTAPAPTAPEPLAPPPTSPPDRARAMRKAVGDLMARSSREIPHYYLATTIDLRAATTWLATQNEARPLAERLVPAALLLTATARAAATVPRVNGHWIDGELTDPGTVHLGVAVSLRGGGLVAPALTDAHELGPVEMMARLRDLVTRARQGALRASEMIDPTITVTNLGDQGVEAVYGVIYPPQVALVGFGRVVERPWAVDGMVGAHPVVTATLAADHRASDGHDGARLLETIDRLLQHPEDL